MFVILLGPPGAGKGTQADLVAARLEIPKISTGDLFRDEIRRGTELGQYVAGFINRGEYVPDDTTLQVLGVRLDRADAQTGAVLDGFPRTTRQAQALDQMLRERGHRVDRVIDVRVPTDELLQRLSGRWTCRRCHATYNERGAPPKVPGVCDRCGGDLYQREDDTPDAVRTRLRTYDERTAPLVDYYAAAGVLVPVSGDQPRDDVTRDLLAAIQDGRVTT